MRTVLVVALCFAAGCKTNNPDNDALVDPLKQRLLAREDMALQNLLLARTPAYSYSGSGGRVATYSHLDEPYDGPAVEPPLPDLNLLPDDMPPWEESPEETPPPDADPTPIQPVPTEADPMPAPEPLAPISAQEAAPETLSAAEPPVVP